MPKITVQPHGTTFSYEQGRSLLDILLEPGTSRAIHAENGPADHFIIDNPCNGTGVCGKCRVQIIKGELPPACETEEKLLGTDLEKGIRLSCMVYPESNLEVMLLQKERKSDVLTAGYLPEFAFDTEIHKVACEIKRPALHEQTSYENQLLMQTGAERIAFEAIRECDFSYGTITAVLWNGVIIALEDGDTQGSLYGVAIDIGTTTVVCSLINMQNGEELASSSRINAQKHFGLDVLTRITYEQEHPEDGTKKLQEAIAGSINEMIAEICMKSGISQEAIYEVTVGANCTMMHMLLGIDASSIGRAPFAPMFARAQHLKASDIGIHAAKGARLYCLPSVSAYIGADIVAGSYVCGLRKEKGNTLFIDIGTNGEIVLSNRGRLLCCSCAAGPALEGMNITAGMRAAEGAIEEIEISEAGVDLQVIGEEEPAGLCGSGILSAVKELLKAGLVKKDGAFIKLNKLEESDYRFPMLQLNGIKREFILTEKPEKLIITQGDIRQVQLAKGAILSGFLALLKKAGIQMEQLDKIMIAGQFGAHLPVDSLIGVGILPEEVKDKIIYVGNSSKTGAYMALMSGKVKREMEAEAQHMDYMELGATDGYERLFSECLIFPGHQRS